MITERTVVKQRVRAGIQWLDENVPDWRSRIDVKLLDMGKPCRCILGQLYGSWEYAPLHPYSSNNLRYNPDDEYQVLEELGFEVSPYGGDYSELQKEWLIVLQPEKE